MTDFDINELIKKIREKEKMISELQETIDEAKNEIKAELDSRGETEINTGAYIVRYKEVVSNRFDSKSLKKDNEELYNLYLKESISKRFTIQ